MNWEIFIPIVIVGWIGAMIYIYYGVKQEMKRMKEKELQKTELSEKGLNRNGSDHL